MEFTYSDDCFSDLHKDVYGFRPRDHRFYAECDEEKQKIWDELCHQLEVNMKHEKIAEVVAVEKFEARIQDVIELGAGNRTNALLWITGTETFYSAQCVEHFVWEQGILFTQYGKQLVKDLAEIVDYKEYDYA